MLDPNLLERHRVLMYWLVKHKDTPVDFQKAAVRQGVFNYIKPLNIEDLSNVLLEGLESANFAAPISELRNRGYAPGDYMSKCRICEKRMFNVDKRASSCYNCAWTAYANSLVSKQALDYLPAIAEQEKIIENARLQIVSIRKECAHSRKTVLSQKCDRDSFEGTVFYKTEQCDYCHAQFHTEHGQ